MLDDTLVVFTSDHGYFYGEHGLSVERRLAYEESIRIPLLMRYPRLIRSGTELGALVLSLDVAPTLLDQVTPGMRVADTRLPGRIQISTSPEEWKVEAIDNEGDGACYVTTFSGPGARDRAHDYARIAFSRIDPVPEELEARLGERLKG